MNKYVQEYLEKKNAQKKEELKKQALKIMNNLRIGEREYPENSDYDRNDYPYWDTDKGKYYRYNAGDISEEDIEMLVQESNDEPKLVENAARSNKLVENAARSNWYGFATAMIIIGGLGVFITFIIAISDSYDPNWIPFLVALISYLFELGFWATVQLLAGIKQGIDNLQNK